MSASSPFVVKPAPKLKPSSQHAPLVCHVCSRDLTIAWNWTKCGLECDSDIHENDAPVEVFQALTGHGPLIVSPLPGRA